MEDLHYYMQFIKFGMGRCTWDCAQEVRANKLERSEAVALVSQYDSESPREYLSDILQYLDISESSFWETIKAYRTPHLWDSDESGNFTLSHQVH